MATVFTPMHFSNLALFPQLLDALISSNMQALCMHYSKFNPNSSMFRERA